LSVRLSSLTVRLESLTDRTDSLARIQPARTASNQRRRAHDAALKAGAPENQRQLKRRQLLASAGTWIAHARF
jgi:hypothetical protein